MSICPKGLLCRDLSKFSVRLSVCLCVRPDQFCSFLTAFLESGTSDPRIHRFGRLHAKKPVRKKRDRDPFPSLSGQ